MVIQGQPPKKSILKIEKSPVKIGWLIIKLIIWVIIAFITGLVLNQIFKGIWF